MIHQDCARIKLTSMIKNGCKLSAIELARKLGISRQRVYILAQTMNYNFPPRKSGKYGHTRRKDSEYGHTKRWKYSKDPGKCIVCGRCPPAEDHKLCTLCADKKSEYERILTSKRVENHICSRCGHTPVVEPRHWCDPCLDKHYNSMTKEEKDII